MLTTLIAAWIAATTPPADARTPVGSAPAEAERSFSALVADLADDNRVGNLNAAMFELAQPGGPFRPEEARDAWCRTRDLQVRDALTAVHWYHYLDGRYVPDVARRTVAMLAQFEGEGNMVSGTLWGQDCMAMSFLASQVALEREFAGARPVTAAIRALAHLGHGRAQFLGWCLLAFARDPSDRDAILDFLQPHVEDNAIARDSWSAMRALREVATTWPDAVAARRSRLDTQGRAAIDAVERAVAGLPTDPRHRLHDGPWPRLPPADAAPFDALHGNWSDRTPIRIETPAVEFEMGPARLRFTQEVVFELAAPNQWLEAWTGGRWTTLATGYTVQGGLRPEEVAPFENTLLRADFPAGRFSTSDGSEFIAIREDRGAANGMAWNLVVIPMRNGLPHPAEAFSVSEGRISREHGEPHVHREDIRIGFGAYDERPQDPDIVYRWDGCHWIDVDIEAGRSPREHRPR